MLDRGAHRRFARVRSARAGRHRSAFRFLAMQTLRVRLAGLPKAMRDIARKAQVRLSARYRGLSAGGKRLPVIVAAIEREIAAFLWAIGHEVAPL